MISTPVSKGDPIEASQYNNLRSDVIANASAIAEVEATLEQDLDTHIAAAASIHGLGAGVNVLGAKQGSGLRIEYGVASATWTHVAGEDEVHSAGMNWANPFSVIYAVVDSHSVGSVSGGSYVSEDRGTIYSTTGATKTLRIFNSQNELTSMVARFIAIGI